ncbi:PEPxxWA-CTERM sorting domain-containing protein [Sandarakinorhabdus oryzae]|uniref:PEPxxWA-CTERM sorting domain-containing protein n=1 Tax=Sandarakinorhabdus oryzae TaxID=2675220 RepID=UPI0018CC61EC|nr:PEPxxWA-CTERM sorting domain-containing protein [Sandarakinorhabdus oryzae]
MFKPPELLFCAALILFPALPASATTSITSAAFGLSSTVKVINTVGVTVGPVGAVAGATAPGYAVTGNVASLNTVVDLGVVALVSAGLRLRTGVISTAASANGTTPADTTSGDASALVNNLNISLFTTAIGSPVTALGLTATSLNSQTQVVRIGNATTLQGQSTFSNLALSVLGVPILSLGANATVAPNFLAYDLAGLRILLNEQISGTGPGGVQTLLTNALHISFNNFLLGGRALTGDIIVSQSQASISFDPVPEPAAWTQLIAGFGLAGVALRRRRARQPAA